MLDLLEQLKDRYLCPAEAFIQALYHLETREPLPEGIRAWLVEGFASYATGKATTLESALGLQVKTGRYTHRLQYLLKQANRDRLLTQLVEALPYKKTAAIKLVSAALADPRASENWPPESLKLFRKLCEDHPGCPRSTRQLERILNKQTTAQKTTDIKSLPYVG